MPHLHVSSVAPTLIEVPALAPALQRRLRHVSLVKRIRSGVAQLAGGLVVVSGAAFALPAMAAPEQVAADVTAPAVQQLVVAGALPLAAVPRDSYAAIAPPSLQYPLPFGSSVASGYGPRVCANCSSNFHHGIDIFPGAGTPIATMASGVVSKAEPAGGGSMGVSVTIDHVVNGEAVTSVYGHLQVGSMPLNVGDTVAVGEIIGRVGATGNANGAHLHFEVRPGGGASVNPYEWIAARI
ncbi:M23 family metallopeptidase [Salinibacterium sp. SYSU T00001]|uniref:M23 family metallopeptidase n=1 Tax=Homoserinimonas sedimenticola TaxID=2986805 RepID=UPI002235DD55|nr:M23 family metallopeptidase [Salinibacterium sedimenticola]MCW4384746.1 M23 family metallopeptidase [Salinibacterium sedimenticola]